MLSMTGRGRPNRHPGRATGPRPEEAGGRRPTVFRWMALLLHSRQPSAAQSGLWSRRAFDKRTESKLGQRGEWRPSTQIAQSSQRMTAFVVDSRLWRADKPTITSSSATATTWPLSRLATVLQSLLLHLHPPLAQRAQLCIFGASGLRGVAFDFLDASRNKIALLSKKIMMAIQKMRSSETPLAHPSSRTHPIVRAKGFHLTTARTSKRQLKWVAPEFKPATTQGAFSS